jgi:hypothetical protein
MTASSRSAAVSIDSRLESSRPVADGVTGGRVEPSGNGDR